VAWIVGTLLLSSGSGCGLQEHPRPGAHRPTPPASAPASYLPSAAGIEIGGAFVPRERAVVFIHFGHSNMAGVGLTPEELQPWFFTPHPRLWSYQGGGRFAPAVEPTAPEPTFVPSGGPGLPWLRTVAAAAGPEYHFISIGWARSGAASDEFLKGGLYYAHFMDRALELKGKVSFGGVFIMLGITELPVPVPPANQQRLADNVARIVADIRADLDEPDLPILHTDYEMEAGDRWAVTQPIGMSLRAQFIWLPRKVRNLALIPADGTPMTDNHHFDLSGMKMWVERGVQIMRERGWFPWEPVTAAQ
jgi:hypothetical protein